MKKRAVFLDRDGVINEVLSKRVKFVNKPEEFYFLPGVPEAIKKLNRHFDYVFVVTNQGGVGLGYLTEKDLRRIHDHMKRELKRKGAEIHDIACCIHPPHLGCECRKPGSKMIEDLAEKYGVDLSRSYMVGDQETDIAAGKRAGTKTIYIGAYSPSADASFPDLAAASDWMAAEAGKGKGEG